MLDLDPIKKKIEETTIDIPALVAEIEQLRAVLFEIAQAPYPLHDHCSKKSWEFACSFVAEMDKGE